MAGPAFDILAEVMAPSPIAYGSPLAEPSSISAGVDGLSLTDQEPVNGQVIQAVSRATNAAFCATWKVLHDITEMFGFRLVAGALLYEANAFSSLDTITQNRIFSIFNNAWMNLIPESLVPRQHREDIVREARRAFESYSCDPVTRDVRQGVPYGMWNSEQIPRICMQNAEILERYDPAYFQEEYNALDVPGARSAIVFMMFYIIDRIYEEYCQVPPPYEEISDEDTMPESMEKPRNEDMPRPSAPPMPADEDTMPESMETPRNEDMPRPSAPPMSSICDSDLLSDAEKGMCKRISNIPWKKQTIPQRQLMIGWYNRVRQS